MTAPSDGGGGSATIQTNGKKPALASHVKVPSTTDSHVHRFPVTSPEHGSVSSRDAIRVYDPDNPLPIAKHFINDKYKYKELPTLKLFCNQFFAWNGTHYSLVEEQTIRARFYEFLEPATCLTRDNKPAPFRPTQQKVSKVLDALRALVHVPADSLSLPAWIGSDRDSLPNPIEILPCTNGLLHLPTLQLQPSTPAFFSTNALKFSYEPDAPEPREWLKFLDDIWSGDEDSISALQEMIGYLLLPDTRQQKGFFIIGPKRSGKGTIGRVLRGLLGSDNICAPTLASLSTNFGLQPLIGKQLAIVSDARLGRHADEQIIAERLLSISGEDALTIDRKHIGAWTGQLVCRFLIMTNELFRILDPSGAFWSRFIILKLTKSFYGREDITLIDRLLLELPGILIWSIKGWQRLQSRGHFLQPQSSIGTVQELDDLANPVGTFVQKYCVVGPDQTIDVEELYKCWKVHCIECGYDRPGDVQTFGRDLAAAVPSIETKQRRDKGERSRYFIGIGLE